LGSVVTGIGASGVREDREQLSLAGMVDGRPAKVDIVGIPDSLLARLPYTRATDPPREGEGAPSMRELVERGIYSAENNPTPRNTENSAEEERPNEGNTMDGGLRDGEGKNPKSRRMDYDCEERRPNRDREIVGDEHDEL
jgi:hypothetical protein